jgi:hypothetical protein
MSNKGVLPHAPAHAADIVQTDVPAIAPALELMRETTEPEMPLQHQDALARELGQQ